MFKPKGSLLALFMFLPITPSIAAITVFTKSIFNDYTEDYTAITHHSSLITHNSSLITQKE